MNQAKRFSKPFLSKSQIHRLQINDEGKDLNRCLSTKHSTIVSLPNPIFSGIYRNYISNSDGDIQVDAYPTDNFPWECNPVIIQIQAENGYVIQHNKWGVEEHMNKRNGPEVMMQLYLKVSVNVCCLCHIFSCCNIECERGLFYCEVFCFMFEGMIMKKETKE
ncbi:hypothetical protein RFI_12323 [Reticulomyxa filosa]|uniref:Uncharacterized protein n=1 Tax=Reticulomyxa filosa TaxID=46433 RepID=X6NGF9_RETFI|nr:hypothetical protein RFI_12323 [Reticulomyxa filosa]|eukprot:ETO24834.1 hypothetical protein RFI_12323 [Reticulomyxa filosa]